MKYALLLFVVVYLRLTHGLLVGPYLVWGHERIHNRHHSVPLTAESGHKLASTNLFANVKAVIVYVRYTDDRLDGAHYPKLRQLISNTYWSYLPQRAYAISMYNHSTHTNMVNLTGSRTQQDTTIAITYLNEVTRHGNERVLGVLACSADEISNFYNQPTSVDFKFRTSGKAYLFHRSVSPLKLSPYNGEDNSYALIENRKEIVFNEDYSWSRMNIVFRMNNTRLGLRLNFTMSASKFWFLSDIEIDYREYATAQSITGPNALASRDSTLECPTPTRSLFYSSRTGQLTMKHNDVRAKS